MIAGEKKQTGCNCYYIIYIYVYIYICVIVLYIYISVCVYVCVCVIYIYIYGIYDLTYLNIICWWAVSGFPCHRPLLVADLLGPSLLLLSIGSGL